MANSLLNAGMLLLSCCLSLNVLIIDGWLLLLSFLVKFDICLPLEKNIYLFVSWNHYYYSVSVRDQTHLCNDVSAETVAAAILPN